MRGPRRPATCHDPARGRQRQFQFRCRRRATRALAGAVPRRSGHVPGKTREGVVPLVAGGRRRPGRARDCGRPALPAVVPAPLALLRLASGPRRQASGHCVRLAPVQPTPPPTDRREPASARQTLAPHRHQPPASATFPGFPGSCPLLRGTAPVRARVARLPCPARRAVARMSAPALTPAVPETGPRTDTRKPIGEQTRGCGAQGWFQFCFMNLAANRPRKVARSCGQRRMSFDMWCQDDAGTREASPRHAIFFV
jgi:hypothetical protein